MAGKVALYLGQAIEFKNVVVTKKKDVFSPAIFDALIPIPGGGKLGLIFYEANF